MRISSRHLTAAVLLASVTAGCGADEGLVARVADLEREQTRLADTVATAPDDDVTGALAADVSTLRDQLAGLRAALDELSSAQGAAAVAAEADAQAAADREAAVTAALAELGDRLDALAGRVGALEGSIGGLRGDINELTDSVASVRAQFLAHRDDPVGHR